MLKYLFTHHTMHLVMKRELINISWKSYYVPASLKCTVKITLPNFIIEFENIFPIGLPSSVSKNDYMFERCIENISFSTLLIQRQTWFACLLRNCLPLLVVLSIPNAKHPSWLPDLFHEVWLLSVAVSCKQLITGAARMAQQLEHWLLLART